MASPLNYPKLEPLLDRRSTMRIATTRYDSFPNEAVGMGYAPANRPRMPCGAGCR